jgi:hypothetical protein
MQDIYLSFTDENEANSVLYTDDVANYQNIDVIGTVYQRPTKPISIDEEYIPVPYPPPNFGVNIRLMEDEDIEPLKPYIIYPKNPIRIWG